LPWLKPTPPPQHARHHPICLEKLPAQIATAFIEMRATSGTEVDTVLDILRERANHNEMMAHGVASVLIYDTELVVRSESSGPSALR
jgi:hypothetical protein